MRGASALCWTRAATATTKACARHIGTASEREKVWSCSGTGNSTRASGDSVLSEMAMMSMPFLPASSTTFTTSLA